MSSTIANKLLYGKDIHLASPADAMYVFEKWKPEISPNNFHPLIGFTGGMSIVGGPGREMQAVLIVFDWLSLCRDAGADVKNASICLASNFDDHMGMVALALEGAMISTKPRTTESLKITAETYLEIVNEVFGNNYAGIWQMATEWGVGVREDFKPTPAHKTRSMWRKELGHDVLIHPVTLEPCRERGEILRFNGLVTDEKGACRFKFGRADGSELVQETFPSLN